MPAGRAWVKILPLSLVAADVRRLHWRPGKLESPHVGSYMIHGQFPRLICPALGA